MKGNPCVRKVSMYRKRLTVGMKNLAYLDDRPVFEIERLAATAWAEGGAEAENDAKVKYHEAKDAKMRQYTARGRDIEEKAKKQRKDYMKKMLDELRDEKESIIKKREDLKATYKKMNDDDPHK